MEMIKWEKRFSINVSKIDEEHKYFISIVNKVIKARQKNNEGENVSEALNEMTLYSISHFKTEENYMKEFGYPEYELHKEEHRNFTKTTVNYCNTIMNGNYNITDDIFKYLRWWLINHIQGTDKKLTECFNKNGLY